MAAKTGSINQGHWRKGEEAEFKKPMKKSYSSSESDSETESDSEWKHMKSKGCKWYRKHGHSDYSGARRLLINITLHIVKIWMMYA